MSIQDFAFLNVYNSKIETFTLKGNQKFEIMPHNNDLQIVYISQIITKNNTQSKAKKIIVKPFSIKNPESITNHKYIKENKLIITLFKNKKNKINILTHLSFIDVIKKNTPIFIEFSQNETLLGKIKTVEFLENNQYNRIQSIYTIFITYISTTIRKHSTQQTEETNTPLMITRVPETDSTSSSDIEIFPFITTLEIPTLCFKESENVHVYLFALKTASYTDSGYVLEPIGYDDNLEELINSRALCAITSGKAFFLHEMHGNFNPTIKLGREARKVNGLGSNAYPESDYITLFSQITEAIH